MKGKIGPVLAFLVCIMAGEQLLFNSSLVTGAIRSSLELCVSTIIPSLFCFMVLSAFLSGSGLGKWLSLPLLPLMKWLKLPSGCGGILLMSLLGGYPAGAKGIRDAWQKGQLGEGVLQRLCLFCICPAPSFVIVALGERLLGNRQLGLLLYGAQVLALLLLAALSSFFTEDLHPGERLRYLRKGVDKSLSAALVDAVDFSCHTLLHMCGFVVLFGVTAALLGQLPLSSEQHSILSAALEITVGSRQLAESGGSHRLQLLAFFLSFGGTAVLFQLKNILQDVPCSFGRLLTGRILHGGLSVGIFQLLLRCFPQALEVLSGEVPPLAIHNSSTPLLSGCFLGMTLILLGSFEKSENK